MPALASPHKSLTRHRSTSPLPPPVPAKAIDLNSSTRSTDRETGAKITRRAFLCDVVVEREGEETANLLHHLGRPLAPLSTLPAPPSQASGPSLLSEPQTPSRARADSDSDDDEKASITWSRDKQEEMVRRLQNLIEELVRTERSYLTRIQALKKNYADPLRNFARQEYSKIIPMYEAKALFANIDNIVPASAAFSHDLEGMLAAGRGPHIIGDICLKHMRDLRTFDPYRTYLSKQDESQKMFQDVLKKYTSFASFIERTKYQTTGMGNIGLRELLMEPVQRIPRYTLLFSTMVKCMPRLSTQRVKLLECVEIASRIAKCEPDPQTVRATVMYCLERNVDGFPAKLFSNNRDYIDSIDADDLPVDLTSDPSPGTRLSTRPLSVLSASTSASTPSLLSIGSSASSTQMPTSPQTTIGAAAQALSPLHCTLFLFDDKLMIVKRQSSAVSGRKVTGLDDVPKLVKSGGGVAVIDKNGVKKDKLSYRGIVDVLDIIATDVGNGDFHLYFASPPADQGERWSLRQFRSYTTVQPPYGAGIDTVAMRKDKLRFLQNLWSAQALARAKVLPKQSEHKAVPRVMMSDEEFGLDAAGEMFGRAKCFWNVWDRPSWIEDARKAKVAIHIDEDDMAPELSLVEGDPCLVIRLQPMAGGLCRFSHATAFNDGEGRALVDMGDVQEKIVTTIHRYGIFRFRTSANSCPTTPSSQGHRLRPSLLNLDAISRNLFGNASLSSRSFGSSDKFSSANSHNKVAVSRTSTMDTRFSDITSDEGRSLAGTSDAPDPHAELDLSPRKLPYLAPSGHLGQSEVDLNERLNLARRNSKTLSAMSPTSGRLAAKSVSELRTQVEARNEELHSRAAKMTAKSAADLRRRDDVFSSSPTIPRKPSPELISPTAPLRVPNRTPSPTKGLREGAARPLPIVARPRTDETLFRPMEEPPLSLSGVLATSIPSPTLQSLGTVGLGVSLPCGDDEQLIDRSPAAPDDVLSPINTDEMTSQALGPQSPTAPLSPRPLGPRSPTLRTPMSSSNAGTARTKIRVVSGGGRKVSIGRETIPLKGFDENHRPPADTPPSLAKRHHSSEQLTPRKKSPNRSPLALRDDQQITVPDPLRVPSGVLNKPQTRRTSGHNAPRSSNVLRRASAGNTSVTSQTSRTSTTDTTVMEHKSAEAAVSGMRRKIAESRAGVKRMRLDIQALKKQLESGAEVSRPATAFSNSSLPRSPHRRNINRLVDHSPSIEDTPPARLLNGKFEGDTLTPEEAVRALATMAERVEVILRSAAADGDQADGLVHWLTAQYADRDGEARQLQAQVIRGKEVQEVLRSQLSDVQTEVDVIYEAFNQELDGMFEDAQLPSTEAFEAMRRDLQEAKARRNDLALENMKLKRDLEEANLKREQWSRVLREKGML